jgi:hypothetical protein
LIFLVDNTNEMKLIEEKIEIILSERISESEEYFLGQLNRIITQLIRDFIKIYRKQIELLQNISSGGKNIQVSKSKSEMHLLVGEYKLAHQSFASLSDLAKQMNDMVIYSKSRENMAIALFLEDLMKTHDHNNNNFNVKELKFNLDIESNFDAATQTLKKLKLSLNENIALIEIYFKQATYYIYFETKIKQFLDTMKRIYDETESILNISPNDKLFYLLKMRNLYNSMNMKRKSIFFLFMALGVCFENSELTNLLPFLFKEINAKFFVYDIYNEKIENPSDFQEIHKTLVKSNWKKISFNSLPMFIEDKKEMKETSKKRIDKDFKLYVVNRLNDVKKYLLTPIWEPIQYNIYLNLLNFYKNVNDLKMYIIIY